MNELNLDHERCWHNIIRYKHLEQMETVDIRSTNSLCYFFLQFYGKQANILQHQNNSYGLFLTLYSEKAR